MAEAERQFVPYAGLVVSRGAIRNSILARAQDEVWRATLGWSRTLGPFWLGAIERFTVAAAIPDERRAQLTAAAEVAFDRMDDWWHGRVQYVKARRVEIDSSISFLRNTALRGDLAHLVQVPVARHAAGALRVCLHLASGAYHRDQLADVVAGLVYDWACCRTLFPGDPAVLLQAMPSAVVARRAASGADEFFDEHHLLFGEPADLFHLRTEADAVFAEAASIWASFDDPAPWRLPDDIWTRTYDGTYAAMHYGHMRQFHSR